MNTFIQSQGSANRPPLMRYHRVAHGGVCPEDESVYRFVSEAKQGLMHFWKYAEGTQFPVESFPGLQFFHVARGKLEIALYEGNGCVCELVLAAGEAIVLRDARRKITALEASAGRMASVRECE